MIIVRVTLKSKDKVQVIKNVKSDRYAANGDYVVTDEEGQKFKYKKADVISINAEEV